MMKNLPTISARSLCFSFHSALNFKAAKWLKIQRSFLGQQHWRYSSATASSPQLHWPASLSSSSSPLSSDVFMSRASITSISCDSNCFFTASNFICICNYTSTKRACQKCNVLKISLFSPCEMLMHVPVNPSGLSPAGVFLMFQSLAVGMLIHLCLSHQPVLPTILQSGP